MYNITTSPIADDAVTTSPMRPDMINSNFSQEDLHEWNEWNEGRKAKNNRLGRRIVRFMDNLMGWYVVIVESGFRYAFRTWLFYRREDKKQRMCDAKS